MGDACEPQSDSFPNLLLFIVCFSRKENCYGALRFTTDTGTQLNIEKSKIGAVGWGREGFPAQEVGFICLSLTSYVQISTVLGPRVWTFTNLETTVEKVINLLYNNQFNSLNFSI